MIELSYLDDTHSVKVHFRGERALWPTVRSALQENAEEIYSTGPFSIRVPVWSFLSCRRALAYTATKYRLDLVIDDELLRFIRSAQDRENQYQKASGLLALPVERVLAKLESEGFGRQLTKHQLANVCKLTALPSGATFSVPGAGKTTEALAYYAFRREPSSRLLVVAPKNAFAAWEEQIALCFDREVSVRRLVGGERRIKDAINDEHEISLITYQQLSSVKNTIAPWLLNAPTSMFLDESHRIKKGSSGLWASTVLGLSHLPTTKLIMTGTPLPNSLSDLIPQLNFIYPELDASNENVSKLIKPVYVRTTKAELGLPPVNTVRTIVNLNAGQRELYELLRSEEARRLSGLQIQDKSQLRRFGQSIMRLLQLVSNPSLLAKAENASELPYDLYSVLAEGDSPKIAYACIKARRLARQGRKVIIWSSFVENVETIALRLADLGAQYIHGGVEAGSEEEENTREYKIARFHDDDSSYVLVANPAACAEGISLHTVCHDAIYIDRNYNAAQFLQSMDRIHRLGLPSDTVTTVEILHSPDTIDESVSRRLALKVSRMAKVLEDESIHLEPEVVELDNDGIVDADLVDFIRHLETGE